MKLFYVSDANTIGAAKKKKKKKDNMPRLSDDSFFSTLKSTLKSKSEKRRHSLAISYMTYLTYGLPRLSHSTVTLRQLLGFSSLVFSRSVCSGQQTSSVQDLSDLLVVVCRLTHVLGLY